MTLTHTNNTFLIQIHLSKSKAVSNPFTLLTHSTFPTQYPTEPVNLLHYRNHLHTSYILINTYTEARTTLSFPNIHALSEHIRLSPIPKYNPGQRLHVAISLLHIPHPPRNIPRSHTQTHPHGQQRLSPSREEDSKWNQSSRLWWHRQYTCLGISSLGAASDSPCRADNRRPGSCRVWSSPSKPCHPDAHISCLLFLLALLSAKPYPVSLHFHPLWGSGSPFSSLSLPHIASAGSCDMWASLPF